MNNQEKLDFINYLYGAQLNNTSITYTIQKYLHIITNIVFAIEVCFVVILGYKKISTFNKKVLANFSDTDNKTISYIKYTLGIFLLFAIISFLINIIGKPIIYSNLYTMIIVSTIFSGLLYFVGYIGNVQNFSISDIQQESNEQANELAEDCTHTNYEALKLKIIDVVETEKIYLKSNLKISDLAALLCTNRNYIYNAINVEMQISFSEFINSYRVKYAQELMIKDNEINTIDLYTKSGFASEISFYRNFKLITGTTPSKWLKANKQKINTTTALQTNK